MLVEARIPTALAARCEAILAAGGPGPPPPGALAYDPPPLEPPPEAGNAPRGDRGGGRGLFSDVDADERSGRHESPLHDFLHMTSFGHHCSQAHVHVLLFPMIKKVAFCAVEQDLAQREA